MRRAAPAGPARLDRLRNHRREHRDGFLSLALFGLALSLPLVAAVFSQRARRLLDRLAALSRQVPRWTGALMVALGVWSAWFGLFVTVQ